MDKYKTDTRPYNSVEMKGIDPYNVVMIQTAIARGETLVIDGCGHVYNQYGRWIGDGMKREPTVKKEKY